MFTLTERLESYIVGGDSLLSQLDRWATEGYVTTRLKANFSLMDEIEGHFHAFLLLFYIF